MKVKNSQFMVAMLALSLAAVSGYAQTSQPLTIFIGGGDAALLAPHLPWPATVWPEMTLEGIRLAAEQLS